MKVLVQFVAILLSVSMHACRPSDYDGDRALYNENLYQGDILGVDPTTDRSAQVDSNKLWPGGVVYYKVREQDYDAGFRANITAAMREYTTKTNGCIRFQNGVGPNGNFVNIFRGNGCYSMVGMQGGEQQLSLGNGCSYLPTICHELGHAIGFWHEQNRSDRDAYVELHLENVHAAARYNFDRLNPEDNYLFVPYDYKSMMQYGEYAFSINQRRTIIPKKPGVVIETLYGRHYTFSKGDLIAINKLYGCNGEKRPNPPPRPNFVCDFTKDWCGFNNQEGTSFARFQRKQDNGNWILEADGAITRGKYLRLISSFITIGDSKVGCVSFRYKITQNSVHSVILSAQEVKTHTLWQLDQPGNSGDWKSVQVSVYPKVDIRFFFSVGTNSNSYGKFLLDDFVYKHGKC